MAMITISSTAIPDPSSYTVGIQDIVEASRNAQGNLVADRIATKVKLELGWKYLTSAEYSTILALFNASFFVSVTYPNPITGSNSTKTFYVGDRSSPAFKYTGGAIVGWKDVKFNLIEK